MIRLQYTPKFLRQMSKLELDLQKEALAKVIENFSKAKGCDPKPVPTKKLVEKFSSATL